MLLFSIYLSYYGCVMKNLFFISLLLLTSNNLSADDKTYSGLYVQSGDVRTFTPCGGETFWADASRLVIKPLKTFYKDEIKEPGQPLYTTVRGHFHHEESLPPVSDYAGIFHISEVYLFSSVVPDTCSVR